MKLSKASSSTLLFLISILLSSSALFPVVAVQAAQNGSSTFVAHAPTSVGPASGVLYPGGPTKVYPFTDLPADPPAITAPSAMPYPNPKPEVNTAPGGDPPSPSTSVPPTVVCQSDGHVSQQSGGSGCDTISLGAGHGGQLKTNPFALNAVDSEPYTVEPPDQGLCAGNGYVMEVLNQGELQVYKSDLTPASPVVSLDTLMGLTAQGWSSGGDIMCQYDYDGGGHWFVTQIVSTNTEASGGPFTGCFAGALNGCLEGIAVSATDDPMGAYNVYFVNPNAPNSDPGKGHLLNDFAKTGITRDAFLMFYDEFNLSPPSTFPACPAYGCAGFNGAQELAFTKAALEQGLPVTSPRFNVAYENMGTAPNLYPIPANAPFQPAAASCSSGSLAGFVCWYQVIPAQTPDPSQYDNANGGTGFMAASLDFLGLGDNRVVAFDWTGLSSLNSHSCSDCSDIAFGGQLFTTQVTYRDEGAACPASQGGFCGLGAQKAGPTPLGDNCNLIPGETAPCPESGIATNGDGVTEASYAQGQLWTSVSTLVTETFNQHGQPASSESHVGVTYWVMGSDGRGDRGSLTIADQGYVAASHEDIEFPSIAAADGGGAVMAFTLSGDGGPTGADNGGFYPSTAYGTLATGSSGLVGSVIHIADLGKSPYDGESEYVGYPPVQNTRPRWGDYSQAIFVPSTDGRGWGGGQGGGVLFSTEYIQSPNCSDSAFLSDLTCGGTRAPAANWGSSINFLSVEGSFGEAPY